MEKNFKDFLATMPPITDDPEFFTIDQQKAVGLWPLSFLPAYGIIPYLKRMKVNPIKGLEVGVLKGENAFVLLESIPTLHLTGVDFYREHMDGETLRSQADMDRYEQIAQHNLSGFSDRYDLIKGDALDQKPENEIYDFVLLDTIQTQEQVRAELEIYYPSIKKGGYIFMHDVQMQPVALAIREYRKAHKITLPLYTSKNFVGFWQK